MGMTKNPGNKFKMGINNYFDKIICINLKRRSDRWAEMQKQFDKHGINVIRFDAIDGNPMGWKTNGFQGKMNSFNGNMGCIASHVNIYKMAKEKDWKKILIIESGHYYCILCLKFNCIFER
jgi:GR25 family glycosyltransferase involved in LPS biosynthesis